MSTLSQTSRPLLVSWGARALYVGPGFALSAHRNAVAVLAVGLERPLRVARTPRSPARGFVTCRAALIEPATLHLLETDGAMAFLYLDARSTDLDVLRARSRQRGERVSFGLRGERTLVALLRDLQPTDWPRAELELRALLGLEVPRAVLPAIDALLARPEDPLSASEAAARCGLSSSRFQHAFKEATGVPFRRFRTWARMRAAMRGLGEGHSLTDAALAAGFSSSAHFSSAFRQMFGLAPSRLSGARLLVSAGR